MSLKGTSSHEFRYGVSGTAELVEASCRRGSKRIYFDFSHDAVSITFNLSVDNPILCCHCLEGPCHLPQRNQKTNKYYKWIAEALSFSHTKRCSLHLFRGEKWAKLALFHLEASFVSPLLNLWVMSPWL